MSKRASQCTQFIFALCVLSVVGLSSCKQNPKACLDLSEVYEVNRQYDLESCSENYEFLTWDYGYKTGGHIGDVAPHKFTRLGEFTVTVDAYSNGAYFSDRATQKVRVTHRYVEHIEIVGNSPYTDFLFIFDLDSTYFADAKGDFTNEAPFVGEIWPADTLEIPLDLVQHSLVGYRSFSPTSIIRLAGVNYKNNVENPLVLSGGGFDLKVYWTYD